MLSAIYHPGVPDIVTGNLVTAKRWAWILKSLGHQVDVFSSNETNLLHKYPVVIALHANKSAHVVRMCHSNQRVIVALTGTDVFECPNIPEREQVLQRANAIIALQDHLPTLIDPVYHSKTHVIFQSAEVPEITHTRDDNAFQVCVSGHLRRVKDPFLILEALTHLPDDSQIRVVHIGGEIESGYAEQARSWMTRQPRYRWLDQVPRHEALQILGESDLCVLTSRSEGGPSVIAESILLDVPVLATKVSGCIGMLGADYEGLFDIGDAQTLGRLLQKSEGDKEFYRRLQNQCELRKPLFARATEKAAWARVMAKLALPISS